MGIKELRDGYFSTCSPCLNEYTVIKKEVNAIEVYMRHREESVSLYSTGL